MSLNINSIEKATDKLRSKIGSGDYYKIILSIVFLKYMTSEIENNWKIFNKKNDMEYKDFLEELEFEPSWKGINKEYLWSNIRSTSNDRIKEVLDGAFISLGKHQPKDASNLAIFSFQNSPIENHIISQVIEKIDNGIHFDPSNFRDEFGQIYEYFIGKYSVDSQRGGEFYTPHSLVSLMISITEFRVLDLKKDIKIYDPTLGSGGMLVQSLEYFTKHNFDISNLYFFGQEIQMDPWKISRMNFLLRNANFDFGISSKDSFTNDLHKNEKFDIILSNPPFNHNFPEEEYGQLRGDLRFKDYGIVFGSGKANYNFFTHIISHLNEDGIAAIVMQSAAGQSGKEEKNIRKKYIDNNLVEALIQLPGNIFKNTSITSNIWVFNKNKNHNDILFVDLTNQTEKNDTQQIIREHTIEEVQEMFKILTSKKTDKKINKEWAKIISKNDVISKFDYDLNVSNHIIIKEKIEEIDKDAIAIELKNIIDDTKKILIDIENISMILSNKKGK